MHDFDHDSLLKELVRVVRGLLERAEPVAAKKRRLFVPEVLDVHPDRVALEPSDDTDPHSRWFHAIRKH